MTSIPDSKNGILQSDPNITGKRIRELRRSRGMTQEELGNLIGIKKAAVQKYEKGTVKNIKRASLIKLADFFNTTVEYLLGIDAPKNSTPADLSNLVNIPVLASVSAGMGAFADSMNNLAIGYEPVLQEDLSGDGEYVFLRVTGDSMYPIFMEGDLVLVRCQSIVDNGAYGVVMIDNDSGVIKRVIYGKDYIELQSVNPMYPPRRFEGVETERIRVFGVVKEVKRKF